MFAVTSWNPPEADAPTGVSAPRRLLRGGARLLGDAGGAFDELIDERVAFQRRRPVVRFDTEGKDVISHGDCMRA
jgi:hypothetical protein